MKIFGIYIATFSGLCLLIILVFIPIKLYALSQEWVAVPSSKYGEQLWNKKSIQRNKSWSKI